MSHRDRIVQKRALHIVPHKQGWAVRRVGASRSTSIHGTLEKAIKAAEKIAAREGVDMFIHSGGSGKQIHWAFAALILAALPEKLITP
jgi:Uncharacterized protein conserved in bacteria (DUF2188)